MSWLVTNVTTLIWIAFTKHIATQFIQIIFIKCFVYLIIGRKIKNGTIGCVCPIFYNCCIAILKFSDRETTDVCIPIFDNTSTKKFDEIESPTVKFHCVFDELPHCICTFSKSILYIRFCVTRVWKTPKSSIVIITERVFIKIVERTIEHY